MASKRIFQLDTDTTAVPLATTFVEVDNASYTQSKKFGLLTIYNWVLSMGTSVTNAITAAYKTLMGDDILIQSNSGTIVASTSPWVAKLDIPTSYSFPDSRRYLKVIFDTPMNNGVKASPLIMVLYKPTSESPTSLVDNYVWSLFSNEAVSPVSCTYFAGEITFLTMESIVGKTLNIKVYASNNPSRTIFV